MAREFTHPAVNEEVPAVSGRYMLLKEDCVSYQGREVLYLVGVGSFDSSCCGSGGCAYAVAPGFLIQKRVRLNAEGRPVSLVEPVIDETRQKDIAELIRIKEGLAQVNFL
jgi:hypothetical protein